MGTPILLYVENLPAYAPPNFATDLPFNWQPGGSSAEFLPPPESPGRRPEPLRHHFCLEGIPGEGIDALDLHKVAGAGKVAGAELGAQRTTHTVKPNLEVRQQKTQSTIATDSYYLSLTSVGFWVCALGRLWCLCCIRSE